MRSLDLARAEEAIAKLVDAQARAEIADGEFQLLNRSQTVGGSMSQFLAGDGSDAKRVLIEAYQASIAEAEEKHADILASEQARLGEEFDGNESPPVRRAKGRLEHLKHALQKIKESQVGDVFVNFARQLLNR